MKRAIKLEPNTKNKLSRNSNIVEEFKVWCLISLINFIKYSNYFCYY